MRPPISRRFGPFFVSVVCSIALFASCLGARPPALTPGSDQGLVDSADIQLFELLVRQLLGDTLQPTGGVLGHYQPTIHVDPRPLSNDPRLVTLLSMGDVIPEYVDGSVSRSPLAQVPGAAIEARQGALRRLNLGETDGLVDAKCPGIMIPPTEDVIASRRQLCPAGSFTSVMIALPRLGGAYWPANLDERKKYGSTQTWSVRVIGRDLTPKGSVEQSRDYVFERLAPGKWKLLEAKRLLIVE